MSWEVGFAALYASTHAFEEFEMDCSSKPEFLSLLLFFSVFTLWYPWLTLYIVHVRGQTMGLNFDVLGEYCGMSLHLKGN